MVLCLREKQTNQTNKQTNKQIKQWLDWLKDLSKHSEKYFLSN